MSWSYQNCEEIKYEEDFGELEDKICFDRLPAKFCFVFYAFIKSFNC